MRTGLLISPSGRELLEGRTVSGSGWARGLWHRAWQVDGFSPCFLPEPVNAEPLGEMEGSFQNLCCVCLCLQIL